MDWIERCSDPAKLRVGMANAKEKGRMDIYWKAFERLCAIQGINHADPLHREFYVMLAAYEEHLSEKNGRRTAATRTRQKLENKGLLRCLEDWALDTRPTEGFKLLIENGKHKLTGEYLVVKYADQFPDEAVRAARERLQHHNVDLSDL